MRAASFNTCYVTRLMYVRICDAKHLGNKKEIADCFLLEANRKVLKGSRVYITDDVT